jgi:hypothetical protein
VPSRRSSLQGTIGAAGTFSRADLVAGTHVITASATDSGSLTGSSAVTLTVETPSPPNTAPTVTITAPTNGITVTAGTAVTFSATATDTNDGNVVANLVWTSNLQGQIGTGASFSRSDLVNGLHAVSAVVTDSGGLVGSATVGFTVEAPPQVIALSVVARKVKNKKYADLSWSGAIGANVEIHRNNVRILASTPNDGAYTDQPAGKGNTFTYRVCEVGGAKCSNSVTVTY